jgi:tRNA(Ile)-lysidine synthase
MDCNLETALELFIEQHGPDRTYWVAFSGGMDSHVLLHLLARVREETFFLLKAVHVNHSLSVNALSWAQHCSDVCRELQVNLKQLTVQAKAGAGDSPEEIAREKRYAVLSSLLLPNDFLLTAHHQDDQAETLLLQLLRGAGPKGLASMPEIKASALGFQVRPLLKFPRSDLFAYAQREKLNWVEDESNTNTVFSRNFIRQEILPALQKRWPGVTNTFARVAAHCAEAQSILDNVALIDLAQAAGRSAGTLSLKFLSTLNPARQRLLLRYWLQEQNFLVPDTVKLQQIQREILGARADKNPHVAWKNLEVRRYRDDIFVMQRLTALDISQVLVWDLAQTLDIAGVGRLAATRIKGAGLSSNLKNITVRFRQGGENCILPKRDFTHHLKKLFWEWNIPPWMRPRMPLIFVGEKLAAVPGYFIGKEFVAGADEEGYEFNVEKPA